MEENTFVSIFFIYCLPFFSPFSRCFTQMKVWRTRLGVGDGGGRGGGALFRPVLLWAAKEIRALNLVEMLQETCGCLLGCGGGERQEPSFRDHCSRVREVQSGRPTTQEPRGG